LGATGGEKAVREVKEAMMVRYRELMVFELALWKEALDYAD